jgi:hypothetical protein
VLLEQQEIAPVQQMAAAAAIPILMAQILPLHR